MELTDNTVLITGGGSGIGAGLAGAFHCLGNQVIIAGRHRDALSSVVAKHRGMVAIEVDLTVASSVMMAAAKVTREHPSLNVLVNSAGIMLGDDPGNRMDEDALTSQVATNLAGPIRMSSALMAQLRRQPRAHLVYVSAAAGFTPAAMFSVYSATKAALHSYVMSQRFALKDTRVSVQEIVPPWVGTGLVGPADHEMAMPLEEFIKQTMAGLGTDALELVVPAGKICRNNPGRNEHAYVDRFNTYLLGQSF